MPNHYSVYKGPGNRLVAISITPENGGWVIRSGEEGKRLRHAQVPVDRYPDFEAVSSANLSSDYQLLFTGPIDTYGRSAEPSSDVVYWSATSIDTEPMKERLREFAQKFQPSETDFEFVDDMTGCTVRFGRTKFGVTRAVTSGCINADGCGADVLSPNTAADILALIVSVSSNMPLVFADPSGNTITRGQVLARIESKISSEMAKYLQAHGHANLSVALRVLKNRKQIRF